jgi:hypothetical protein
VADRAHRAVGGLGLQQVLDQPARGLDPGVAPLLDQIGPGAGHAVQTQRLQLDQHVRLQQRRRHAGACRRKLGSDTQSPLWRTVIDGLRCHWSPQQIAGKLPGMNKPASPVAQAPQPAALSVSHETIYCAIYAMPRSTLRTELVGLLRKSHKTRLPRTRGTARKGDRSAEATITPMMQLALGLNLGGFKLEARRRG